LLYRVGLKLLNPIEFESNMPVNINIQKHQYVFIDPATGQSISPEEFAKKYPAVELGRRAVGDGTPEGTEQGEGNKNL
jgi:regulator of sirC expression with transglutaminase-like and TPR domain